MAWHQVIASTDMGFVRTGPLRTRNLIKKNNQNTMILIQENVFDDVFCKMAAILYRSWCEAGMSTVIGRCYMIH